MNDHVPAQARESAGPPVPSAEQRYVAARALYALLRDPSEEGRALAAAHLLDVCGEMFDADEEGFFGGLAASFGVPLVVRDLPEPVPPAGIAGLDDSPDTAARLLARAGLEQEATTTCGFAFRHAPHGGPDGCDGIPRRRKPQREDLPLTRDDGSTFTPGRHLPPPRPRSS